MLCWLDFAGVCTCRIYHPHNSVGKATHRAREFVGQGVPGSATYGIKVDTMYVELHKNCQLQIVVQQKKLQG